MSLTSASRANCHGSLVSPHDRALNGNHGMGGSQQTLVTSGDDLVRQVVIAPPRTGPPGGPSDPGLDGVGQVRAALTEVLELRSPYTLLGDVAALALLLGPFGAEWAQEAEWKRVRGYVLMPREQAVPRPCTEQVRFDDGALSAGTVAMTCGSRAFLMALDPPCVIATEDPLLTGALHSHFWALWQKAEGQSPLHAPTKLDHMKLPDLAPRSGWIIPDSMIDDVRNSQRATFLLNLEAVRSSYLRMREVLPETRIHYSVKTNPDDHVLRLLRRLGSGFEAASYEEIELALQAGARPKDINFSAPVKKRNDIRKAYRVGVRDYTLDSVAEARKIAENAPGARCTVRMVTSAEKGAAIQLSTKFGVKPSEIMPLMRTVAGLGLVPHGVGFHVGGQNEVSSAWQEALAEVHHVVRECRRQGYDIKLVNAGGGFPIPIHPAVPDLEEIAPGMEGGPAGLEYVAEPGRIIVGDAGKLITPVVARTFRDRENWLYINASLFGTLQMMDRHGFYFPVTTDHVSLDMEEYVIASLSCDGSDIISRRTVLPRGIAEGNLLIFHFVGAYSAPVFNISYGGVSAVDIRYLGCE